MLEYTLRTYQSPTRLVQRLGAIRELGTEASLLGIRRPLLVTDPGVKAAGLLDTALEVLRGDRRADRVRPRPRHPRGGAGRRRRRRVPRPGLRCPGRDRRGQLDRHAK